MNRSHALDRITALFVSSATLGWIIARDLARKAAMGRDVYLVHQGQYFDKYLSHSIHRGSKSIVYFFVFALGFGTYELLVLLVRKLHQTLAPELTSPADHTIHHR